MRKPIHAFLAFILLVSAPLAADVTFTDPGPLVSAGAIGNASNSTITRMNSDPTEVYSTWTFSGELTEVDTDTFASEAQFRLTQGGAYDLSFQPTTTAGFSGTLSVSETITGVFWAPAVGSFDIETFESFDDSAGADATWADVSFSLSDAILFVDLGNFMIGSGFVFDTESSDFDTELGGFTGIGGLLATDDNGGSGSLSSMDLGTLAMGDYYAVLGGSDTEFINHRVFAGTATGDYNINLNGVSVATGTLASGGVAMVRFSVVPEPGSLILLFGIGMGVMARRRRS